MTDFARRLSALPPERRAAFLRSLRGAGDDRPAEPVLERTADPADGRFPLSLQQEQLWVFDAAYPGRTTYLVPLLMRLTGPLDTDALRSAVAALFDRHDALRTAVVVDGDRPVQALVDAPPPDLPLDDLTALPPDERGTALDRIVAEHAHRPFELDRAPLVRLRLVRLAPDRHELLWVTHHIVFDGWSNAVLIRDLCALYRSFTAERAAPPPAPPVRHVDYARWQRAWFDAGAAQPVLDRWAQALRGCEPLALPVDHPYPSGLTFDGAIETRWLTGNLPDRVRALARSQATTPFVVWLAAGQALLHRYTGQTDLVIGSALGNRQRSEVRDLIGCLVNVVPLRGDLAGDPSFARLVEQGRAVVLDALDRQDVPLERIVEAVRSSRQGNRLPLVQATLTMQAVQQVPADRRPGGLRVTCRPVPGGSSRFEIALDIGQGPNGTPYVAAEYNTRLFDRDTVARLLEHLEVLLSAALDDPERRVSELALLSADEWHDVTTRWNPPPRPRPAGTIGGRFDQRAVEQPDRVAVAGADGSRLTYGELRGRSDRLAARLAATGLPPEARVGVMLDRSPDGVVALLGVLKAGGAYVPVDPAFPPGRIELMLRAAGVDTVVVTPAQGGRIPDGPWQVITVGVGEEDRHAAPRAVDPAQLAYTLYTSGSTGEPKGVLIEHRSVVNFAETVGDLFSLSPDDRVLQFAPLTFDVSVFELFGALLNGCSVVLCTEEQRRDPDRLAEHMAAERVTVIDLPPAIMALLAPERLPALRVAFVGGEAFSGELTSRWAATGCAFYNGYGPTETTVTVVVKQCSGVWEQSPPIGRAMDNHRAYVLDRALRPVPVNVAGELFIGGAGMARGYLDRPGLTAQAFVPDPVSAVSGARLYRTGDLARWLPTGELEFLGRLDRQVQLHGVRIEVGEVETALTRHPAVRQAVVDVVGSAADRHLAAYLCGDAARGPYEELRGFLADRLPSYMVPSRLRWLDRIPLTSSGKVDREALPPIDDAPVAGAGDPSPGRPPETVTERRVAAEVVEPILGMTGIGADDNLFERGGTSLQLMRALARVRSTFGVQVRSVEFYREPTVARIAAVIDAGRAGSATDRSFAEQAAAIDDLADADVEQILESMR